MHAETYPVTLAPRDEEPSLSSSEEKSSEFGWLEEKENENEREGKTEQGSLAVFGFQRDGKLQGEIHSTVQKGCEIISQQKGDFAALCKFFLQLGVLIETPEEIKPIRCKWVYKRKKWVNRKVETYKAKLVAKGYSKKLGFDCKVTFALVAMLKSIRILLSIAVHSDDEIWKRMSRQCS
ncbi:Retrovirus-related Pol polyprotein from transposon TNT 1-94 [Vitis vinifera]|uniref:Retrovirus-related Pol polyprotein from transposon TNT 1-94 n=1 Tax=Vitis vinifera TaxID=29760 RepID=A0A438JQH3_VITVI|nr:Retrovirus-related Pol polyprotein from transposon TNT 1-94 [Vitis vinifera]